MSKSRERGNLSTILEDADLGQSPGIQTPPPFGSLDIGSSFADSQFGNFIDYNLVGDLLDQEKENVPPGSGKV